MGGTILKLSPILEFVSLLRDYGEIRPELITDDNETREKIRCHPGILRRASMAKRNRLD